MNIQSFHTEDKPLQTKNIFSTTEGKVIAIQLKAGGVLKEHITKVPALLVCVLGEVLFENENGVSVTLLSGDLVEIEAEVLHWLKAGTDCNLLLIK